MGLDKAIEHSKEHRKRYYGAKACDKTCRNHGSDDWAKGNRLYRSNKLIEKSEQDLEDCCDEIDFETSTRGIPVTLEIVKVSKFEPSIDIEDCDEQI
jgi:hypothetical protein